MMTPQASDRYGLGFFLHSHSGDKQYFSHIGDGGVWPMTVDLAVLRKLVNTALKLRRDNVQEAPSGDGEVTLKVPEGELDRLIGSSKAMNQCKAMIAKLARSQAPVLVSGDSGSGKELAAKLIHELGPRADGPFIPVNCGAIPTELMESEFFGHQKGSFTGATGDKDGLFQAADGGTLLLDEIGDMEPGAQAALLRVLESGEVRRVGETRALDVDVRVIASTNRDLEEAIKQLGVYSVPVKLHSEVEVTAKVWVVKA